jgi:hypothetical protein
MIASNTGSRFPLSGGFSETTAHIIWSLSYRVHWVIESENVDPKIKERKNGCFHRNSSEKQRESL